jgi:hypothetical protein
MQEKFTGYCNSHVVNEDIGLILLSVGVTSFTYCDILGFPGNATMKQTCPHNNEADASRQQSKQKA